MSGGRVLIVDDEPDLIEGIKLLLEAEELDVVVHPSLITLPLLLRTINPDVVLLDLSMPALSGTAAFANQRHQLKTDAPVVLFSGRSSSELARLAEELGADGFLCKSDDSASIVHRVKTWILNRRALTCA
jgi:DNA-binding NarL/FixJ family response regulator